ncbi:hypothetical protein OSB04_018364 [Centaurea solstitialis]|uniref:NB-ARC domain-containing protein n=1 Tax=Centaurea solstitialis TaxID=347529 RepID=A0AA38T6D9_9ASTR|nr:hypothetical protein OSB04_018364 [Centaurea solstitialis]
MEEAPALLLKKLFINIGQLTDLTSEKALDYRGDILVSFRILMKQLGKMMLGYENKEVQGLYDEIELLVDRALVVPQFGKSLSDGILEACEKLYNIRFSSTVEAEEIIIGFDDEVETLLDQLTGTSTRQLQVVSIAGMAGLGKTTLARKLYKDPLIEYIFDIRAWTSVSQEYLKRDLLLGILSSFANDLREEINEMSEEQLGEKLYRLLKGRQYLVVLDDIWDCKAWNDLRVYFPDDKTGSRVLFTTRDIDLCLHVRAARPAHVLRLRTEGESWDIFQRKLFRTGICPHRLEASGKVITRKCEGLPLALVITAGLLKNESSDTWWSQIARSLHSFMLRDPSQYMDSLALSYNHLPTHLRHCFLFVGVFPEDYDIPVSKLIWLWIAQGFIHETGCRSLEDIAQDLLMDLIKRSLLMTAKMRADGQIKACRIHDLLRDLCLRKLKEENLSSQIYKDSHIPAMASSSSIITNMLHGISLDPPGLPLSGFCYPFELGELLLKGGSILGETYKSLRILDMESVPISLFPSDVIQLSNLRYLAIQARDGSPQPSISNLVNLQILIISSRKNVVVPKTIWSMVNLRHLCIKSGENLMEEPCFVQETEKDGCPSGLASLQTLSQISPQSCDDIFSRTPNLRKLGFCGPLISSEGDVDFPNFPEKLKKLTLSNTGMDWEEMWAVSLLPTLEVLKLNFHACIGETWDASDAEFQRLKVLKLHGLDLREFVCSRENFPGLQRLVVHHCVKLESIPSDIGRILTLDLIEVRGCSSSAWVSAQDIQKEQESEGNQFLKVQGTNNLGGFQDQDLVAK